MGNKIKSCMPYIKDICGMKIEDFHAYGFSHTTEDNREFFFMDNNADVLAVAHLDTVQSENFCEFDAKTNRILSPVLDDRLGAFVLLEYFLQDLDYDVLLTVDEEKGQSTARHFNLGKKYNWMFSFDRRGNDVVMYQYDTPEMRELLAKHNFETGKGSYSDICELEHLGCKGFNFGIGYQNAHSLNAYADVDDVYNNVEKFRKFYEANRHTHFMHKATGPLNPGSAKSNAITIVFDD